MAGEGAVRLWCYWVLREEVSGATGAGTDTQRSALLTMTRSGLLCCLSSLSSPFNSKLPEGRDLCSF